MLLNLPTMAAAPSAGRQFTGIQHDLLELDFFNLFSTLDILREDRALCAT